MSEPLIVIPARMASTRFPGKPLAEIAGVSMVRRTARIAAELGVNYVVATDHDEIFSHCESYDIPVVMTEASLPSGSDRALAAADLFDPNADIIVNLQGDAPFTDPSHIQAIIERLLDDGEYDIATPAIQLGWAALDRLREDKRTTPFSGTTVIESAGQAVWFSKTIIPALRKEDRLREDSPLSPILRHIGLYGFKREALERFTKLPQSPYEKLEGLEQLRALEDGMRIAIVKVDPARISSPGIDTPDDLARAEALIEMYGDPFTS